MLLDLPCPLGAPCTFYRERPLFPHKVSSKGCCLGTINLSSVSMGESLFMGGRTFLRLPQSLLPSFLARGTILSHLPSMWGHYIYRQGTNFLVSVETSTKYPYMTVSFNIVRLPPLPLYRETRKYMVPFHLQG